MFGTIKSSEDFIDVVNELYHLMVDLRDELEDDVIPEADPSVRFAQLEGLLKNLDASAKKLRRFKKLSQKALVSKSDGDPSPSNLDEYKDKISTSLQTVKEAFANVESKIDQSYDDNPLEIGTDFADIIQGWDEIYDHFVTDVEDWLQRVMEKYYN